MKFEYVNLIDVFSVFLYRQGSVFAFFVPYFCDIPRVAVTSVLGIPVTGKSLIYIIGLQVRCGITTGI